MITDRIGLHSVQLPFLIVSSVIMPFCSFASLVGGTCGPSLENPNVVHFVDLKNCDCDVKSHLKFWWW